MEQHPGFVSQGEIGRVCCLRKSLYGLKQSPRAWFDNSVYYRNSQASIILLVVYVDDVIIIGNDVTSISSLKSFLHGQFHTKDLGMLKDFLGVEVMRSKRGIFLSQRKIHAGSIV